MEAPDFWDDAEVSQKKMKELKDMKDDMETYQNLVTQMEDMETMIEMGYEENDATLIPEIEEMLTEFTTTYDAIRAKTLLSGEYDGDNAIVSLHAGAGGTESCDWAAMLYRMYTRWADDKGYSVDVLDSLDGEEAGIKSVTFQVNGENAYGYLKSPDDKNQLVVDDYAAEVVRDIFRWKLEGMSQQGIADRLNADGVLSPSEYKRSLGMKYISGFKSNPQAKWSAVAVGRILKNPLYIGVMVQGKTGRPNYKIKKLMEKPEDEWIRVPGAHEPIISEVDFRTVSGLLRRDTRIAVQKKTVYPFSGLLFCADCKQNMIRKTVPAGGKKYFYHSCSTTRADKTACTTHNISEALLMDAVRDCIHAHMETVLNIEKTLQFIAALPAEDMEARKIDRQLEKLKADYEQTMRFKMSAYEKFVDHLLNEDEFKQYQRIYTEKCEAIAAAISKRQEELDAIVRAGSPQGEWIAHFKSFRHVDVMERKILVKIIDRIYVYEGNRIEIIFKYQNEYRAAAAYIEQYMERQATQAASTVKEAV